MTKATTNPFTATGPGERHAAFAALAATGPVHRITLPNGAPAWLITGHDEARAALADPRLIKAEPEPQVPAADALPQDIDAAMNNDLLHLDPPPNRATGSPHPAGHRRAARRDG